MKRKKIKTIICHMAILTICMGVFCHGFIMGDGLSLDDRLFCYAETDSWSDCDNDDLVTAFRYYCKSRNLAINGSLADAITSVTTNIFNNICNTIGIDPTQLQAELKKTTSGNQGLRFLFNQTGINAYNRIFAEFLQNNDLNVGDDVDDLPVMSGKYFVDADGNGCFVYITDSTSTSINSNSGISHIVNYGTPYKYTSEDLYNIYLNFFDSEHYSITNYATCNFNVTNSISESLKIYQWTTGSYTWLGAYKTGSPSNNSGGDYYNRMRIWSRSGGNNHYELTGYGNPAIIMLSNGKLYYGLISFDFLTTNRLGMKCFTEITSEVDADQVTDQTVYITTNNNTINNNNYNNNYTIINNDGDYYEDDEEPSPSQPGGGGNDPGGGGDDDDWNPSTPTIPEPGTPGFPIVDLPDIDIPDLPSLDLSLGDLRDKFPFSLPFDIIAVLSVLDGEPQAPHIQATVPIGRWYTWEMDFDFSEFDNYARIFRIFEFIGFCIGLAVFTVHFVKG